MRFQMIVIVMVWAAVASRDFATGYGSKPQTGGSTNNAPPPPPVDHSASIQARKQLADATGDLNKANREVADIVVRLRREFQQKPEWVEAQRKLAGDQAAFDAARAGVIARLQKDSGYASLKAAKAKADADRDALLRDTSAAPEDQQKSVNAAFSATEALAKVEGDALLSDAGAAAARAQLAEDNRKVAALLAEFDGITKQNADWQAAAKGVEQKQQAVADARKALAAAQATEAQAERDRQKQMAQGH